MVLELSEVRHEKKAFIRGSRRLIENIERLMKVDGQRIGKDKDLGWDATTLKEEYADYVEALERQEKEK